MVSTLTQLQTIENNIKSTQKQYAEICRKYTLAFKQKDRELRDNRNRRVDDIKDMKDTIQKVDKFLKKIENFDKKTSNAFDKITMWLQKGAETLKDRKIETIKEKRTVIEALSKEINDASLDLIKTLNTEADWINYLSKKLSYFTGGTATSTFKSESNALLAALKIQNESMKQENLKLTELTKNIIATYSDKADQLISKLNKNIKDANCSLIKTMQTATVDNLRGCYIKNINDIKNLKNYDKGCGKIMKTTGRKLEVYPDASLPELKSCATYYLMKS
ncbi:MAG: hypothetical protein H0U27_07505 [Nitrosopumilus sp.]|nr:hypothetical protein [Nitrosopumilus sp.]